ncbi:hypothetical protein [Bacillus sp. K2I17]|uniref:hypothetical protein n=1 Tax=Bacillus sp. K2I17 TaxID=2014743 RepID=UPI000B51BEEF|nr:hypothetical protein [Bacillus sp. K2I17]OWT47567.1 hypothetical protein CER22_30470 [Bacillus sp. K2I17]
MDTKATIIIILGFFLIFFISFVGWSIIWLGGAWVISFNFNISYWAVFTISSILYVSLIIAKLIFAYVGSWVLNHLFATSSLKHQLK